MADTVDDRRIAPRLKPTVGTVCRFAKSNPKDTPKLGLVWNLSLSGISMLLGAPPKLGDVLAGELTLENGDCALAVQMRIIHVRTVPTGDFIIGAQFLTPLTPTQVQTFVDPYMKR